MSASRRKGGLRRRKHPRGKLRDVIDGACDKCGATARIFESHLDRAHRACPHEARGRWRHA